MVKLIHFQHEYIYAFSLYNFVLEDIIGIVERNETDR